MAIQIDVNNSYQYGLSSAQSTKKSKDSDTLKETRDRYKNADIFVEKEGTDYSSDREFSIILSKEESKLLASKDPKDKKAQDALYKKIDEAMDQAKKLGEKLSDEEKYADVLKIGVKTNAAGITQLFAQGDDWEFTAASTDDLVSSLLKRSSHSTSEA